MGIRCHCVLCGREIEPWFIDPAGDEVADDAAFERWRDVACPRCGRTPRQIATVLPGTLERCFHCDARFDPAALDEVLLHAYGACLEPSPNVPSTGIRGVLVSTMNEEG